MKIAGEGPELLRFRAARNTVVTRLLEKGNGGENSYAGVRGGCLLCHSVSCSYACASASTVVSANGALTSWRPIGRPEAVKPHGTDMAGSPNTSKRTVLRILTAVGSAACAISTG